MPVFVNVRSDPRQSRAGKQRPEECRGGSDGLDTHVAMSAELDVNAALEIDLAKCAADRPEFHRSLTEHQVFVNTANHVFDMDVPDAGSPVPQE